MPPEIANHAASIIRDGFDLYQERFKEITRRAKHRFEKREWKEMQSDSIERLEVRGNILIQALEKIHNLLADQVQERAIWTAIRTEYSRLTAGYYNWEVAETFYNSVTRRVFSTVGVNHQIEFVDTDFDRPPVTDSYPALFVDEPASDIADFVLRTLDRTKFDVPYEDPKRDAALAAEEIAKKLHSLGTSTANLRAQILQPLLYRGRGAYVIGKLYNDSIQIPLILALKNSESGIYIDAVLLHEDESSVLFSFTRSYFHVETERPYDLVRYLHTLMPRKKIAELYISIGYHKHGKTELYRDLLRHLERTDDRFEIAPGERGMVMLVFHLPSYEAVFKIIRDHFDDRKRGTTRQSVKEKYNLVFRHDRAGRLIDAQEFEHLAFDRARFSDELIAEIQSKASSMIRVEQERVVIRHLYVERRVEPFNLYVRKAGTEAVRRAIVDFGNAIRDLAAANIFSGDVLLKNFGVTRHHRVISYDYDELCLITDLNFRSIPQSQNDDQEYASETWFQVADNDFFPEEFGKWMGLTATLKSFFLETHAELFDVRFWTNIQSRLRSGEVIDILPYPRSKRLR